MLRKALSTYRTWGKNCFLLSSRDLKNITRYRRIGHPAILSLSGINILKARYCFKKSKKMTPQQVSETIIPVK